MSFAKQFGLIVLLAAVAGGAYFAHQAWTAPSGEDAARGAGAPGGGGRRATMVTVATPDSREVESRIEAVGTTRALQAVEIVPSASGRIVQLDFRSGQQVAAGDTIARLDDDIERADLAEAEAKLDEAELALARAMTLSESNTISQASVEQLKAARTAARAEVDRALRRFADRTVAAPFDGRVGLAQVEVGARVDDGTVITTLDDLSQIEIEFALPETVYGQVGPGMEVRAASAAFPGRTFTGETASIDSRIDPASRSFKVRAVVPNADLALPAGMFMHLSLVLDTRMALMIPEESVVVEGNQTFVFVVEDDTAHRRVVNLGRREVGAVEVTDGLGDGETIVVQGVQSLRDGAAVRTGSATGPRGTDTASGESASRG